MLAVYPAIEARLQKSYLGLLRVGVAVVVVLAVVVVAVAVGLAVPVAVAVVISSGGASSSTQSFPNEKLPNDMIGAASSSGFVERIGMLS